MNEKEKMYLMAFMVCLMAFASTTGISAAIAGLFMLLAGYNFLKGEK